MARLPFRKASRCDAPSLGILRALVALDRWSSLSRVRHVASSLPPGKKGHDEPSPTGRRWALSPIPGPHSPCSSKMASTPSDRKNASYPHDGGQGGKVLR